MLVNVDFTSISNKPALPTRRSQMGSNRLIPQKFDRADRLPPC
jgi:hypothetical protein